LTETNSTAVRKKIVVVDDLSPKNDLTPFYGTVLLSYSEDMKFLNREVSDSSEMEKFKDIHRYILSDKHFN
jgi:hypothetical protein